MKYVAPTVFAGSFTCPICGVFAEQVWWSIALNQKYYPQPEHNPLRIAACKHCHKHSIWLMETMLHPETGLAPFPNASMPESVRKLYVEAASICNKSPRGAAAILRLAIQVLCKELGEKGKNINDDIASLVAKGLPVIVQKSLDIVRVTGNDAVHPGQIDTDNPEVVNKLFDLVNIIIDYMIALPGKVNSIYGALPQDKLQSIEQRDKSSQS
jgi:hypothetical protein